MFKHIFFLISILFVAFIVYVFVEFSKTPGEPPFDNTPPPTETIEKNNLIRKELGIRQTKDSWTFYGREKRFKEESWTDSKGECKKVKYDNQFKKIIWEYDMYYSGVTFTSPTPDEGTIWEFLCVCYNYNDKCFYISYSGLNKINELLVCRNMSRM